jgi:hypothetical protein
MDGPSPVRLRQIALVARDLAKARQELTSILDVPVIYEDPAVGQWGLENFLVPLGGDIVEVVSPTRDDTTAGRLLDKRGDGGYMIIMQTEDADARRKHIEGTGKGKVIFSHPFSHSYPSWGGVKDEGLCIQYHPKGVKGGVIPELDSHKSCEKNSKPLADRFSPWHPCGADYDRYVKDMSGTAHLHLIGCNLHLGDADADIPAAAKQWSDTFGIQVTDDHLTFTNAKMGFSKGQPDTREGLLFITVAVDRKDQMYDIFERARKAGKIIHTPGDWFEMLGSRWNFVAMDTSRSLASRL